jgi:hypothetical protein
MRAVNDPRTERVLTEAGAGIARVLDARQRHAVVLAVDVVWYIVAALPPDGSVTFGDVVQLLRWFARGFNEDVEADDGGE